jgi:outer membrane protein TolC
MNRFFKSTLLLFLLPFIAGAQEPQLLSLQDALNYAVRNQVSVRNARLDVDIQRAQNSEITGQALPQINGSNAFTYNAVPVKSFLPAQIINPNAPAGSFVPVTFVPNFQNTAQIAASQILFDGSVFVALQARNTILSLIALGVNASEEEVRYNVTKAYQGLIVARRQFNILGQSLQYARSITHDLDVMREAGFVEKIEVDRSQVQLNSLETDSIRTVNMIEVGEQALKYAMGMPIATPIVLADTALSEVLPAAQAILGNELRYDNRIEFLQLNTQLKLNEFDVKRYRYQRLPTLSAFANSAYTYGASTFGEIAKPNNYLFYLITGLNLNVPIFQGRQIHHRVKRAELQVAKTRNNIENLELTIDLQTAQSRSTLRNNLLQLQNQQRNLDLANSVLDLAQKKYKAGVGSNVEVTQAQTQAQQAQNNYFNSLLEVINAKTDLQRALGDFK